MWLRGYTYHAEASRSAEILLTDSAIVMARRTNIVLTGSEYTISNARC